MGGQRQGVLIQSSSQFRSAPPPALDSQQWATEFNEVKLLGRATGSTRTDEQTYIARWWQSAPIISWNDVAERCGRGDQLLERQVPLRFWRPWNAIPRALEDGTDATEPDANWTALLTAPYPEWVSGHNCLDGAHVAVLRMFFGDDPVGGPSRSPARS